MYFIFGLNKPGGFCLFHQIESDPQSERQLSLVVASFCWIIRGNEMLSVITNDQNKSQNMVVRMFLTDCQQPHCNICSFPSLPFFYRFHFLFLKKGLASHSRLPPSFPVSVCMNTCQWISSCALSPCGVFMLWPCAKFNQTPQLHDYLGKLWSEILLQKTPSLARLENHICCGKTIKSCVELKGNSV